MTCRICGCERGREHRFRELQLGYGEEFRYFECEDCGCLQLMEVPTDLGRFYPSDRYYSFREEEGRHEYRGGRVRRWMSRRRNEAALFKRGGLWGWVSRRFPAPNVEGFGLIASLVGKRRMRARIVDVGCGQGGLLRQMERLGFLDLTGVDPYVEGSERVNRHLRILKCGLEELSEGKYDLIMFHHSLEHVSDPVQTLCAASGLLSRDGVCLVRLPVIPSEPWRAYGAECASLDAPRHLFIHTRESLRRAAERAGLSVRRVIDEADPYDFWASELYRRGLSLYDSRTGKNRTAGSVFTAGELEEFSRRSAEALEAGMTGRAAFVLCHRKDSATGSR